MNSRIADSVWSKLWQAVSAGRLWPRTSVATPRHRRGGRKVLTRLRSPTAQQRTRYALVTCLGRVLLSIVAPPGSPAPAGCTAPKRAQVFADFSE
jgi:hypothetical protein